MKKLALALLTCVVLPIQHGVIAQQARFPRIANDWCYPRVGDNGWTSRDICEVQIFDNNGEIYIGGQSHRRGRPTVCASLMCPANSTLVFSPGSNHDPDGDSNGTTVVVRRQ